MAVARPDPSLRGPNVPVVRFGTFELNVRARELRKGGAKVRLPDQALQILQLLAERPGDVVTREELRNRLWSTDTFVDYERSLNTAVRKLREGLGDSAKNPRFIETLPRVGYRLLAPVTGRADDPDASGSDTAREAPEARQQTWTVATSIVLVAGVLVVALGVGARDAGQPSSSPPVRAAGRASVHPEANDLYLKGVMRRGALTYEALVASASYFEQAVAKDPNFAEAHAGLAYTWLQFLFVGPMSPDQVLPRVEAAAWRAVAMDDALAEAHHALAVSRLVSGDLAGADAESRRAQELDPSGTVEPRVLVLLAAGRVDEAVTVAERARQLDPQSVNAVVTLARALAAAGRADAAATKLGEAVAMQPNRSNLWFQLGARQILAGKTSAGIESLEKAVALSTQRNPRFRAYLGYAYAIDGQTARARAILSELADLRATQYISSFGIAQIHHALDESSAALAALERAANEHALEFAHVDIYPAFSALSSEPRFEQLMRRARPGVMASASGLSSRPR